jgi:hypothetical protein
MADHGSRHVYLCAFMTMPLKVSHNLVPLRLIHLFSLIIGCALLAACQFGICVKGTGVVVERMISVTSFTGIALQGSMEVRLTQGPSQEVRVQAQPELIDLLETEVKDGMWSIRTTQCYKSNEPFIIHVTLPQIDWIAIHGSGDVKSTSPMKVSSVALAIQGSGDLQLTLDAELINADVQGSGNMKLGGRCDRLEATIQGSGDIHGGELMSASAITTIQGSGDITLEMTGPLQAFIQGSGSVLHKGEPTSIDSKVSGSGQVKPTK